MSNGVRLIRNDKLAQMVDYAYAAAAEAPVRAIWTAGACPLDTDGKTVAPGDYAEQARQAMRNLTVVLEGADASLRDIVKTTVYVASPRQEDLVEAWEVVREHMGGHDAPSTTARRDRARLRQSARRGRSRRRHHRFRPLSWTRGPVQPRCPYVPGAEVMAPAAHR
jgi:enamine deaminase RidA (YjgF/YER057c/UK114 family)